MRRERMCYAQLVGGFGGLFVPGAVLGASQALGALGGTDGRGFQTAIHESQGTCLLPFGILEKHGPHLPIGTDLLDVRYAALHAAEKEYAVVFPEYYFGQIFEARHEPGTIAYSSKLQLDLLQETTDEMARNGCKKIIIVNGHGGNEHLLPFFAQTQLEKSHDYVVYVLGLVETPPGGPPKKTTVDMHAGESETSIMMISTARSGASWTGQVRNPGPIWPG